VTVENIRQLCAANLAAAKSAPKDSFPTRAELAEAVGAKELHRKQHAAAR